MRSSDFQHLMRVVCGNEDCVKLDFALNKDNFITEVPASRTPRVSFLGGQPGSGKLNLIPKIKELYPNENFLVVNGDYYRWFAPLQMLYMRYPEYYFEGTQIYAEVYKKEVIREAIDKRISLIIVESMKNTKESLETIDLFKNANFRLDAHIISTPLLLSKLEILERRLMYLHEEIRVDKYYNMTDHLYSTYYSGFQNTLKNIYLNRLVDKIRIYDHKASRLEDEILLIGDTLDKYEIFEEWRVNNEKKQLNLFKIRERINSMIDTLEDFRRGVIPSRGSAISVSQLYTIYAQLISIIKELEQYR